MGKEMIEIFNKCMDYIKSLFRRAQPIAPVNVQEAWPVKAIKKQNNNRKSHKASGENYGTFIYFDDVLDRLDSYFKYIRYLKKDDPQSFDLYSRVGGQIIGSRAMLDPWELPSGWIIQRPSFGMVHFCGVDDSNSITPKLAYFQKFKGHANLQPIHGEIYRVTMYYVKAKNPKIRIPLHYHVHVSDRGEISLIKERTTERLEIKHRHAGHGRFSTVTRQTWAVPEHLLDLFKDHADDDFYKGITVNEAAARLFRLIAGVSYTATDGVRVNVYKGQLCGVFNVAMDRTAYFFKDRDKTVSASGKSRRIFHAARAHIRTMPDGKQIPVRMHFRGERSFTWKGYKVLVTVSGKHHVDLNDFNIPAEDNDTPRNDNENVMDMEQMGLSLREHISGRSQ
jgi:hypothetical protein